MHVAIQPQQQQRRRRDSLFRSDPIVVAVDTEYEGPHTLTVQAACRIGRDTLGIKVYRSPATPKLPPNFHVDDYLPHDVYGNFFRRPVLRSVSQLREDQSPVRLMRDLIGRRDLRKISCRKGQQRLEGNADDLPSNVEWDDRHQRWTVPELRIVIVGHFLPADFGRIFGAHFFHDVLGMDRGGAGALSVLGTKLVQLAGKGASFLHTAPRVEYVLSGDGAMYGVRLEFRDTILPFGPGSLDRHGKTFLGLGKVDSLTESEKANMTQTFRDRPAECYGYAVVDVVNTLLLYEEMASRHVEIYREFRHPQDDVPSMRPTLGRRVSDFLIEMSRSAATESEILGTRSARKALMAKGGISALTGTTSASRFGDQTGAVHGGLLLSRTPTCFWHQAPGMLRDVDLAGCYNKIVGRLNLYCGKPVIFEPGKSPLSLRQAVELAMQHADPDAWQVRVTGDIRSVHNILIPSTLQAITADNYRSRTRRKTPSPPSRRDSSHRSKVFSGRIEAGIVTHATWLMIQAMPDDPRSEYESLRAEQLVLYPKRLIARSGQEYDELIKELQHGDLPWSAELDLEKLELRAVDRLDDDYACLHFPLHKYARRIGELRAAAQHQHGKGSGQDLAYKLLANTMYGVLTTRHYPTSNFVAANQITAMARAEAFAMAAALNGLQVITDGCTYRRDCIPACSFEECLRHQPDYPLRHADEGSSIPMLSPSDVPQDDAEFTGWYREHVKRFFQVEGAEYDDLFGTHELVHKTTGQTGSPAFDALGCDGSGNYLKCLVGPDGEYSVQEMAARGYRNNSKAALEEWMATTYSSDKLTELAPVTEDTGLLKLDEAKRKAREALDQGIPEVYVPLGLSYSKVKNYKAIRLSAFVFQTPKQYATIARQVGRFVKKYGCGLEVLALRRSYGNRRKGSLSDLATQIYELIEAGGHDLTKHLNLNRPFPQLDDISETRRGEIAKRRAQAREELLEKIDAGNFSDEAKRTGIIVPRTARFVVV